MTTTSTGRKLTRFQYAATLLGALAALAMTPAIAHATDNDPAGPGGGCHYTDADGYDIPSSRN
jgi:Spy/CpxP family protein refolding chaperone